MSKQCKECGHQMDDNVQVCPNCGCPVEDAGAAALMDEDVLNYGISTDAESVISTYAKFILLLGKICAWVGVVIIVVVGIITPIAMGEEDAILFCSLGAIVLALIHYFLTLWLAKFIWAAIMLFVNISLTLKRIEIKK